MLTVSGQLLINVFELIADFLKLPVKHIIHIVYSLHDANS